MEVQHSVCNICLLNGISFLIWLCIASKFSSIIIDSFVIYQKVIINPILKWEKGLNPKKIYKCQ